MKYTKEDLEIIQELRESGSSWKDISERFNGASITGLRSTYCRSLKKGKGVSANVRTGVEKLTPDILRMQSLVKEHRALTKKVLQKEIAVGDLTAAIRDAVSEINKKALSSTVKKDKVVNGTGKKLTFELLFSDSQIGKLIKDENEVYYDTEIAKKRIKHCADVAVDEMRRKIGLGYEIEEIIVAFLGDIIESDAKHETSYYGVDSSTSEQISVAISTLFRDYLAELHKIGAPINVIGVAGNHDWDRKGMSTTRPGRTMLTYPIYVALEEITKVAGMSNVTFNVPSGTYAHRDIYGFTAVYEHGYQLNNIHPDNLTKLKHRRMEQMRRHITYFRVGDKHQQFMLDNGHTIVNGAMFHDTRGLEYSGDKGFSSAPGQYIVVHTPRKDSRNSIYYAMQIQLSHIK